MADMKLSWNSRVVRIVVTSILIMVLLVAIIIFWLSRNLTHLVEQALRRTYGQELSLGRVEWGWNRLFLHDLRLKPPHGAPGGDRISIGKVVMTPQFSALLSRRIEIDLLRLESAKMLVEIAPDGSVIFPTVFRSTGHPARGSVGGSLPLIISRVEVDKGELILLDRGSDRLTSPGVSNRQEGFNLLRLSDGWLHAGRLEFPLKSSVVPFTLFLTSPGPGSLRIDGTLDPVSLDAGLKITLRHWDLTRVRPYYLKPESLDVTRGFLDGDATVVVAAKKLHAPGEIRIKEVELERRGGQGRFLGMSAKAFSSVIKNDRGEIVVPFLLEGDLNNPRFEMRRSLVEQIEWGIAHKPGAPVVFDVGSGIINLGKKGLGEIRSLFGGRK